MQRQFTETLRLNALSFETPQGLERITASTAMQAVDGSAVDPKLVRPFVGLVTWAGRLSDHFVGGTEEIDGGPYKTFIPVEVAEAKIGEISGTPVFANANLDSHEGTEKVGRFVMGWLETEALDGRLFAAARTSGLLDIAHRPKAVGGIVEKARRGLLGFSFDIRDIWFSIREMHGERYVHIHEFSWIGATVLFRDKAAYGATELAAKAREAGDDNRNYFTAADMANAVRRAARLEINNKKLTV